MGLFSNMIMGKGNRPDYTPDMMPKNRWELFFEMLRLNFLNLLKLNLMYFVFWIPFWIWTWLNLEMLMQYYDSMEAFVQSGYFSIYLIGACLCVAITGPAKAAMKYITRNYARDEHVWLWSDFWSAFKTNWKQGLAMSVLTGVFMFLFFYGLIFYNNMASATGSTMYLFLQMPTAIISPPSRPTRLRSPRRKPPTLPRWMLIPRMQRPRQTPTAPQF